MATRQRSLLEKAMLGPYAVPAQPVDRDDCAPERARWVGTAPARVLPPRSRRIGVLELHEAHACQEQRQTLRVAICIAGAAMKEHVQVVADAANRETVPHRESVKATTVANSAYESTKAGVDGREPGPARPYTVTARHGERVQR